MHKNKLQYNYVLVSQYAQKKRITIGKTIIQLKPNKATSVKLTHSQKQHLDNLISSTYEHKIAFIPKKEEGN